MNRLTAALLALWLAVAPVTAHAGSLTLLGAGKAAGASNPATFNPSDKETGVALSGGDLTATGILGYGSVRSYTSHSTGKYCVAWSGGSSASGVMLGTDSLSGPASSQPGAYVVFGLNGEVYHNGVSVLDTGPGDIQFATCFDFDADLMWVYNFSNALWNGSPTADPATGTEGLAIAAGTYFVVFSGLNTDTTTFDFNVTGAAIGFGPWQ